MLQIRYLKYMVIWTINFSYIAGQAADYYYYYYGEDNFNYDEQPFTRHISIVGDNFTLDGKPFRIISGSIHYFRIPSQLWQIPLLAAKAAGLNTISTYVEWSFHEPEERQYSFKNDTDVRMFIKMAAKLGLYVLLRPGPYICAERDLGGLPYWLLGKYPNIKLRTTDKDFIKETKIWMKRLFKELSPLLYENGGPIILVQVENEYGSYGKDMKYKIQIRDIIKKYVGSTALLYTTDGSDVRNLNDGSVQGALTTLDAGPYEDLDNAFKTLRSISPYGPLMNSEYYTGWLTHWGENMSKTNPETVLQGLDFMMKNNISFNMYMFYGGTNFGFSSGANLEYLPTITSYDYDAPFSEAMDTTYKYHLIRELMIKYNPEVRNITPPPIIKKKNYGIAYLDAYVDLLSPKGRSLLGKYYGEAAGTNLPTFEKLRQRAGLLLYEMVLNINEGVLEIEDPRDRVYVYVNYVCRGLIDRQTGRHRLKLRKTFNTTLSLLVENQGRINYGYHQLDFKGILSNVTYDGVLLAGKWKITGFPLHNLKYLSFSKKKKLQLKDGPILYQGTFDLPFHKKVASTFLYMPGWSKGYAWINNHCLGRYWPRKRPQLTLYVPEAWLHRGRNYLQLLELEEEPNNLTVQFIDYPIFTTNLLKSSVIMKTDEKI